MHDYYDIRLRDIMDIEERCITTKSDDKRPPLSEPETNLFNDCYEEYNKGYMKEKPNKNKWGQTKWITDLREVSISRAVKDFGGNSIHIWKSRINICLSAGMICYILGMIISFCYVVLFIWHYYDS